MRQRYGPGTPWLWQPRRPTCLVAQDLES
jgi:hypothetical protein